MSNGLTGYEPTLASPLGSAGRGLSNNAGHALDGDYPYRLEIEFTGSGSEYFRIWIVNLLLMLLTLGIYFPWAKVRRLRYFYGNTLVGGQPLDFRGDPKKMLKGYFLVGLMFVAYSAAENLSGMAAFIALLIVASVWPAMLKSAMQFRQANTSWRGMRVRFNGTLGDAYRTVLPMFVPGLVILGAISQVDNPAKPPHWYLLVTAVVGLATIAVVPWILWKLKKYQHNHYALASLQTSFQAGPGSFYKLLLKTIGLMMLAGLMIGASAAIVGGSMKGVPMARGGRAALGLSMFLVFFLLMGSMLVIAKPWLKTRLQNLVWTNTFNASLRFTSQLRFASMLRLSLKNWFFIVITLGLYWPFAAIASARLRLAAVTVETAEDPEDLINAFEAAEGDAAGQAGDDFFGLDIGL